MRKQQLVIRKYRKPDSLMLEQAQVMQQFFLEDADTFSAFDPLFTLEYGASWLSAITTADNLLSDVAVVDRIQVLSHDLYALLLDSRDAFQSFTYFVKKVWPDNGAMHELFGLDKYNLSRRTVLRMYELLQIAHSVAEDPDYKPRLLTAGCTQASITGLLNLSVGLNDKNVEQEKLKRLRRVRTIERINAMNAVWEFMVQVSEAAKIVFAANQARIDLYMLYPEAPEGKPKYAGTGELDGTVTDTAGAPVLNARIELLETELETVSTANGEFTLDDVPAGIYAVQVTADGFEVKLLEEVEIKADKVTTLDVVLTPMGAA